MRSLKFRAWDHCRMIYGVGLRENGIPFKNEGKWYYDYDKLESDKDFEGAEVMQFTGLKDKNGKRIYEGDIVRHVKQHVMLDENDNWIDKEEISFVEYKDHGFWVHDEDFGYEGEDLWNWSHPEFGMEVIGNIYENSELIKETTNG